MAGTKTAAALQAICEEGLALHRQGRLDEARERYKRVLQRDPRHASALRLLAHIATASGQAELAASLLHRAATAAPGEAVLHAELGEALRDAGRPAEALASFDRALALAPGHFEAWHNRGLALVSLGRPEEAVASYDRALALRADLSQPHYNRGVALQAADRLEEALASYDGALARDPRDAEAHNNRGIVLGLLKRYDDALAALDRAIAISPRYAGAHDNRGVALQTLRRHEDALESHARAIALDPGYAPAHAHHSNALIALGRPAEALASAETATRLAPGLADAWCAWAMAQRDVRHFETALSGYDKALELQPGHADARFNRGLLRLLLGRFADGWRDYDARKHKWDPLLVEVPDEHLWTGEQPLAGRRLFAVHEQGLGDTIQFSRYIPLLLERGAEVVMSAQLPLHPLMARLFPGVPLVGPGVDPGPFDLHAPLMSLPGAFGTTLADVPQPAPGLVADPARRARLEARLGPRTKPRVGLVWSGNPDHRNDHNRSIAFERLAPLLDDAVEWIALQTEIRPSDRAAFDACGRVRFLEGELGDFGDTAALIETTDLVISVDTSVAHLAGAMGRPLWLLLPSMPDFRWMLERTDSPWYPSARLFRQPRPRDWESVIAALAAELPAALGSR